MSYSSLTSTPDDRLLKAIEDGEKLHSTFTVTFLFACLYIGLTVLGTDDRLLLLDETLTLQPLDVSVQLTGFYLVVPAVVLVLHLHLMLLQHVLVKRLRSQGIEELGDGNRAFFLPPKVFRNVPEPDDVWVGYLVQAGLFLIHAALPIVVLCLLQYTFLPYHNAKITLWHQLIMVSDLAIIWIFLGWLRLSAMKRKTRTARGRSLAVLATLTVLFFSFLLAIVPGTQIERWLEIPALQGVLKRNLSLAGKQLISSPPAPDIVASFEERGESRDAAYIRHSVGATLAGRNLRWANFEEAKLYKADLRGADLRGSILEGVDLRGANLAPLDVGAALVRQPRGDKKRASIAQIMGTQRIARTRLDRVSLRNSKLAGANLILASLVGVDLRDTNLAGLELTGADLRDAFLQGANLAGAELSHANLDGARLSGAHLEGATLDHASLVGAVLDLVHAPAANFISANLDGAQLTEAVLSAADFRSRPSPAATCGGPISREPRRFASSRWISAERISAASAISGRSGWWTSVSLSSVFSPQWNGRNCVLRSSRGWEAILRQSSL
jgi:uncharacterized protein YjbI with pentapeptide repeats